ncbi:MAG: universal stress protein [Deltaproteobacteria bacterium]|nr:MAG: universal stress protein [Deltaproteobacteria bacterium]
MKATMFQRILVPVDFSDNARAALALAVRIAAESAGELTILNVVQSPQVFTADVGIPEIAPVFVEVTEQLRAASERRMAEWVDEIVPEPMPRLLKVVQGRVVDEILREIESGHYDLVVMGAHGTRGLRGALLGSTTNRVARKSPVPVLVTH